MATPHKIKVLYIGDDDDVEVEVEDFEELYYRIAQFQGHRNAHLIQVWMEYDDGEIGIRDRIRLEI